MTSVKTTIELYNGIFHESFAQKLMSWHCLQCHCNVFFRAQYAATRPHLGGFSNGNRGMAASRWSQQQGQGYFSSGGGNPEPIDLDAMTSRGGCNSTVICFFCQKPGHFKRDCRQRIEAIRKLDNSRRYNDSGGGSGGSFKGKKKQFHNKKPRGDLNATDNNSTHITTLITLQKHWKVW